MGSPFSPTYLQCVVLFSFSHTLFAGYFTKTKLSIPAYIVLIRSKSNPLSYIAPIQNGNISIHPDQDILLTEGLISISYYNYSRHPHQHSYFYLQTIKQLSTPIFLSQHLRIIFQAVREFSIRWSGLVTIVGNMSVFQRQEWASRKSYSILYKLADLMRCRWLGIV